MSIIISIIVNENRQILLTFFFKFNISSLPCQYNAFCKWPIMIIFCEYNSEFRLLRYIVAMGTYPTIQLSIEAS